MVLNSSMNIKDRLVCNERRKISLFFFYIAICVYRNVLETAEFIIDKRQALIIFLDLNIHRSCRLWSVVMQLLLRK